MKQTIDVRRGLTWGLGAVLGPVIGGAFETATWRWAFYINLIIGALFAPTNLLFLPSFDPSPGKSIPQRLTGFDLLGAILSIAALVTLILVINFGGTLYAWESSQTIALFVLSGVLFILFAVQQSYLSQQRLPIACSQCISLGTKKLFFCSSWLRSVMLQPMCQPTTYLFTFNSPAETLRWNRLSACFL